EVSDGRAGGSGSTFGAAVLTGCRTAHVLSGEGRHLCVPRLHDPGGAVPVGPHRTVRSRGTLSWRAYDQRQSRVTVRQPPSAQDTRDLAVLAGARRRVHLDPRAAASPSNSR